MHYSLVFYIVAHFFPCSEVVFTGEWPTGCAAACEVAECAPDATPSKALPGRGATAGGAVCGGVLAAAAAALYWSISCKTRNLQCEKACSRAATEGGGLQTRTLSMSWRTLSGVMRGKCTLPPATSSDSGTRMTSKNGWDRRSCGARVGEWGSRWAQTRCTTGYTAYRRSGAVFREQLQHHVEQLQHFIGRVGVPVLKVRTFLRVGACLFNQERAGFGGAGPLCVGFGGCAQHTENDEQLVALAALAAGRAGV